jgi:hypothetical protein
LRKDSRETSALEAEALFYTVRSPNGNQPSFAELKLRERCMNESSAAGAYSGEEEHGGILS